MSVPQVVDLMQPLAANRVGPPPLWLNVSVTPTRNEMVGGVPQSTQKNEKFVLLSALPVELRQRVELAIQARISAL